MEAIEKKNILRTVKGTAAIEKEQQAIRTEIIDTVRKFADNYGYDEMTTPQIYDKQLLTCKFEEGAELADEIYTLSDRGERTLALRYDLTVPLARYIAENPKAVQLPFKRFETGEVFRDGPVKSGRARQFTQCDVDVVGDVDPVITAYEQMSLALQVFDALGLPDVKMSYSSRRLINGVLELLGVPVEARPAVLRALDKKNKVSAEEFMRELTKVGLSMSQVEQLQEWMGYVVQDITKYIVALDVLEVSDDDAACNRELVAGIQELTALSCLLEDDDLTCGRCELSVSLVRGQDYYTGIMFEAFAPDYASSLAGGGRYDSIIGELAGVSDSAQTYSASGLSFGVVPIAYLLEQRRRNSASDDGGEDIEHEGTIIIPCGTEDVPYALRLANEMRRRMRVEVDADKRGVSKKMKAANKAGYRFVIVLGENERDGESIGVKDMSSGKTLNMPADVLREMDEATLDVMFG